jgi:hypothetical protein
VYIKCPLSTHDSQDGIPGRVVTWRGISRCDGRQGFGELMTVATQRKQLAGGVIRAGYEMRSEGIRITDAKLAIRAA